MKVYALINSVVCLALAVTSVSSWTTSNVVALSNFRCLGAGDPHFTTFGGCRHHYPGVGYSTLVENELFTFDFHGVACQHDCEVVTSSDGSHLLSGPSCMNGYRIELRLNKDCPTVTTHVLEYHRAQGLSLDGNLITDECDLSIDNSDYDIKVVGDPTRLHSVIELSADDETLVKFQLMRRRFILDVNIPTMDSNNFMLDSRGLCGPIDIDDCAVLENRNGEMRSCDACEISEGFLNRNDEEWHDCNEFLQDWHAPDTCDAAQSSCPVVSAGRRSRRRLLSDELDNDDEEKVKQTFAEVQSYAQGLGIKESDLMCSLNEEFVQVYDLCAEDLVPADGLDHKQKKERIEAHLTCLVDFCVMHDLREALADANEFNDEIKLEEEEKNE